MLPYKPIIRHDLPRRNNLLAHRNEHHDHPLNYNPMTYLPFYNPNMNQYNFFLQNLSASVSFESSSASTIYLTPEFRKIWLNLNSSLKEMIPCLFLCFKAKNKERCFSMLFPRPLIFEIIKLLSIRRKRYFFYVQQDGKVVPNTRKQRCQC
eukprot:TRINITY_DN3379_c0_g1_i1.p1 TRINITY_DN3379_c0_g1~~TRINITY_DN3379_c0_g1_i1.p1  ORF type:complete len:151 (-),score=19.21 TRINITY_DN3379_c0_g1_i1:71-523(-)